MGPFTVGQIPADPQVWQVVDDNGNPKSLSSYTSMQVIMTDPDGIASQPGSVSPYDPAQIGKVVWIINTAPSIFTKVGLYKVVVKLIGPGNILDFTGEQAFNVEPAPGTALATWASLSDVASITNKDVAEEDLLSAQFIIEMVVNRTPNATKIGQRDLIWLKRAVAYQTAWMKENPDIFSRHKVLGIQQDGVNTMFASKDAVYLGPLAIRAIKNVSWMRSKSLRMITPFIDRQADAINPLLDDSILAWEAFS